MCDEITIFYLPVDSVLYAYDLSPYSQRQGPITARPTLLSRRNAGTVRNASVTRFGSSAAVDWRVLYLSESI